ncbi:hypothetical protein QYF61_023330 [Mycteria americana]|uniref:RNase H type-1 domain-containing protein n=1 Tax=Mycteria americana TaxID=33587 RepID=A0AAN7RXL8_MYCAM|nr:hypothetical protein QYF61_023330 [Mycteria americana]
MTGWCRSWIYNYGIIAKPLYELLKNNPTQLIWSREAQNAFKMLKKELMKAPALGLPDITNPFWLFSHEKQGVALGVLAQRLGLYKRAVAYFSKQLDETVYSSRPDLKEPLEDAQDSWFTDGSSFVRQGIRKAGYAVTTASKVIESQSLPAGTSAQKAEIIALTRALELAKGKKINIWTDSKYAFGVVHAHGAIWKERGLLTAQGRQIKHAEEILHLLEVVQLPTKVAIMHCRGHLKGNTDQEKGNRLADYEAKQAAERMQKILTLIPDNRSRSLGDQENVEYSRADKELIEEMGGQVPSKGWAHLSDGKIIIPAKQGRLIGIVTIILGLSFGKDKMEDIVVMIIQAMRSDQDSTCRY